MNRACTFALTDKAVPSHRTVCVNFGAPQKYEMAMYLGELWMFVFVNEHIICALLL